MQYYLTQEGLDFLQEAKKMKLKTKIGLGLGGLTLAALAAKKAAGEPFTGFKYAIQPGQEYKQQQ